MIEKRLFRAFDLQRFAGNARLQAVIDAVHARCQPQALSDEQLDLVAAAGQPEEPKKPEEPSC